MNSIQIFIKKEMDISIFCYFFTNVFKLVFSNSLFLSCSPHVRKVYKKSKIEIVCLWFEIIVIHLIDLKGLYQKSYQSKWKY